MDDKICNSQTAKCLNKISKLKSPNIRLRFPEALLRFRTSMLTCPQARTFQKLSSHCEDLFGWDDGCVLLGRGDWFGCEGALQVHIEDQTSGQQQPLVLVEAREGVKDSGAAIVHPVGKQAAGRDAGRKCLVMVELQLAREPAAISISITVGWRTWLALAEASRACHLKKNKTFYSFITIHFITISWTLWCQRRQIQTPGSWANQLL